METTRLTPEMLDAIADEHEALTELYEQILNVLQAVPAQRLRVCTLLDELVEKLDKHFMHEEEGGYYSHVLKIAPWRAATVEELKRQHADLSSAVAQIARAPALPRSRCSRGRWFVKTSTRFSVAASSTRQTKNA